MDWETILLSQRGFLQQVLSQWYQVHKRPLLEGSRPFLIVQVSVAWPWLHQKNQPNRIQRPCRTTPDPFPDPVLTPGLAVPQLCCSWSCPWATKFCPGVQETDQSLTPVQAGPQTAAVPAALPLPSALTAEPGSLRPVSRKHWSSVSDQLPKETCSWDASIKQDLSNSLCP